MQRIKTHSYWTITAVCRYRDTDGSCFSPSCCHMNWPWSGIRQQRHPVDMVGKFRRQRQSGSTTEQVERSELVLGLRAKRSWLKPLKPLSVSQRCFLRSSPPFDLWFLRQHFLDLINVSCSTACSFPCCARWWELLRCDSWNTLWFIKGILSGPDGKMIPNQTATALVRPRNPHQRNHRTAHGTISICPFFGCCFFPPRSSSRRYGIEGRPGCQRADGILWSLVPRL